MTILKITIHFNKNFCLVEFLSVLPFTILDINLICGKCVWLPTMIKIILRHDTILHPRNIELVLIFFSLSFFHEGRFRLISIPLISNGTIMLEPILNVFPYTGTKSLFWDNKKALLDKYTNKVTCFYCAGDSRISKVLWH